MRACESTDKSIFQGISGVGMVFTKGTQSVCERAQNSCGDRYSQVLLSFHPLEGLLLLPSFPALRESTKIFILQTKKKMRKCFQLVSKS